jgi:mannan endo-1,4-beta-mannosidase
VNITVKTFNANVSNTQWVYFDLQITNNGSTAIPLSQLTGRFWYTWDESTSTVTQAAACDTTANISGGCGSISTSFVTLSTPVTGADHYLGFGFSTAAGSLAAGASASFELGFHKNDFSTLIRTNDYSYNPSTSYSTVTTVTVYVTTANGTALVYGIEPM